MPRLYIDSLQQKALINQSRVSFVRPHRSNQQPSSRTQSSRSNSANTDSAPASPECSSSRRAALLAWTAALVTPAALSAAPAWAGIVGDAARLYLRPDVPTEQAIVALLDVRGVLYELRDIAATPADSKIRFQSRRILPGMAKRLREVQATAPFLVALVQEGNREATLSPLYGGLGNDEEGATPLYEAIGKIVTISGRTIRIEAQDSPERAEKAILQVEALLAKLPADALEMAKETRRMRN